MPRYGVASGAEDEGGGAPPGPALPPPLERDPHPGPVRWALHGAYDLALCAALAAGTPWLLWRAARRPGFGRMVAERLGRGLPARAGDRPRVLVHGVSVGEVKAAVPLVEAIERAFPEVEVVLSASTDTGLQVARELFRGRAVVRFPGDLSPVVRRFLARVAPALVVLVELEIWPNFLRECNRTGAPVVVVNGRITTESHARYVLFRRLLPQFDRLSLVCVQREEYAERFRSLGVDPRRVVSTGSLKADRLRIGAVDAGPELARLLGGGPGQLVLVAGSTHDPEERHVLRAWREGAPEARLVLVPRHPGRCAELARELAGEGEPLQLLSRLRAGAEAPDPARPALVDTIGELERVYGLADVVFVGGSLVPHGGHNVLEPAAQGRPVLVGPSLWNCADDAALLQARGALRRVEGPDELGAAVRALARDPVSRSRMAEAGLEAVRSHKGATARTLDCLARAGLAALAPREAPAAPSGASPAGGGRFPAPGCGGGGPDG